MRYVLPGTSGSICVCALATSESPSRADAGAERKTTVSRADPLSTLEWISVFHASGPADQWSEVIGTVEVPDGAGRLLVLLGVRGQKTSDDAAWFDDVEVYPIKFE